MPFAPPFTTLRERLWLACNDLERILKRVVNQEQIDIAAVVRASDDLRRNLMELAERIEVLEQHGDSGN